MNEPQNQLPENLVVVANLTVFSLSSLSFRKRKETSNKKTGINFKCKHNYLQRTQLWRYK